MISDMAMNGVWVLIGASLLVGAWWIILAIVDHFTEWTIPSFVAPWQNYFLRMAGCLLAAFIAAAIIL